MSERELVTENIVLNALRSVGGISAIPGGSGGRNDVMHLQHDGKTLAHAITRPLNGNRPHSVRLRHVVIPWSELPEAVRGSLRIDGTENVVVIDETNTAEGVKLIEYLVAQQQPDSSPLVESAKGPTPVARQPAVTVEGEVVASTTSVPPVIAEDVVLRDFIGTVAATFDRAAGMSAPAQQLLRRAPLTLHALTPVGFRVVGSGGTGVPANIPWFGFLDPDETDTPLDGLYVVYLFSADLAHVYLTLIQGITKLHSVVHPPRAARLRLQEDGARIRGQLGPDRLAGFESSIDLGAGGRLPEGYESGAVAAIQYTAATLPAEAVLRSDLTRMLDLYQDAIQAKRVLLTTQPGAIATPSGTGQSPGGDESTFDHFKPKSSAEYTQHVAGGTFKRTRRHEALIKSYGEWARANGFKASTAEHPKDLVLRRDGIDWMLEGEVLRGGNAAHAVREAIGQLFEYRRFLYTDAGKAAPVLVGLFSEHIGEAYLALLDEIGILAVWREGLDWRGCERARIAGLTSF